MHLSGVQEYVKDNEGGEAAREVNPEDPSPIEILREYASQKRADTSGDGPDETGRCQEHAPMA
jgi:hypothetical protein